MSMKREFDIVCDICHKPNDDPGWFSDEVRAAAKADGWKKIKAQDVCAECQEVKA